MKIKPDNWTHHHVHRLYHLSMGICFSFITMMVLVGTITGWLQARAQTQSETVAFIATVPDVSPGPIIPGNGGGGPTPVPPPQQPQIQPPPPTNTPTTPPSNGPTNSPAGNQNSGGNSTGTGSSTGAGQTASRKGFYSIFLQIPDHYKKVQPGQRVIVNIQLANNNPKHVSAPVDVNYTVENSRHEIIVQATDTMILDRALSFSKVFTINPSAAPDIYTILAQTGKGSDMASASDTFAIVIPSPLGSGPAAHQPSWQQIILILILILLVLAATIAYHHIAHVARLRDHKQDSDKPSPRQ